MFDAGYKEAQGSRRRTHGKKLGMWWNVEKVYGRRWKVEGQGRWHNAEGIEHSA